MARDPEAQRLASRLLVLYAWDQAAAQQLARLAELHTEASRRLDAVERQQVTAAAQLERVSGSRDETDHMLGLVQRLGAAAGQLRRLVAARREGLRRQLVKYEEALGYRDPARGRQRWLRGGRQVEAIQWTQGGGPRRVEPPGTAPPDPEEADDA